MPLCTLILTLCYLAIAHAAPNPQGGFILTAGTQPNSKFSTCYVTETHKDGSKGQNLWMLQNDVDMKNWGDPPGTDFHPVWGSHAETACDCAVATGTENNTPYFVWDGNTKKCYPKYLPNPVRAWARASPRYYKVSGGGSVVPPASSGMTYQNRSTSITETDMDAIISKCAGFCTSAQDECDLWSASNVVSEKCLLVKLRRVSGIVFGWAFNGRRHEF